MSLSQNDMGRAFEYALAMSFSNILPDPIIESKTWNFFLEGNITSATL